jgi:glycosyltransferase involved in cell wall biosynthesis
MKILNIVECAGGVERYLEMVVPRLAADGIEQEIVCSHSVDTSKLEKSIEKCVVTDMQQTFNPMAVMKIIRQVKKAIKEYQPDIVYCHSSFAGVFGRIAALGTKCKVVYNPHGWAFNRQKKSDVIFEVIERLLAKCTDRIVCISEAEKQSAIKHRITNEDKLMLIPNGIDIDAIRSAVPIGRKQLGINKDAFVVGMIGRLSTQKAPDVFIHAAKLIHDQIPNSAFIIVGDGDERESVEGYARENHLNLVITGWTNEPYRYLKDFDTAMLLSRWEGFGLAVVEYMAAEKNVVATRIDAIPTLIDDKQDGLLVNVDDSQDAAEKVLWLHSHLEKAASMRDNALRKVKEKYDIQRVINQHIAMFKQLSGGGNNIVPLLRVACLNRERRAA